jgi:hypothetical protein
LMYVGFQLLFIKSLPNLVDSKTIKMYYLSVSMGW